MTNRTRRHRPRETVDQESFIKAVQTILDYLWDDEQQHHSEYGGDGEGHVFNSLQLIRDRIDRMRQEAAAGAEADESVPTSCCDYADSERHEANMPRRMELLEGDFGTYISLNNTARRDNYRAHNMDETDND